MANKQRSASQKESVRHSKPAANEPSGPASAPQRPWTGSRSFHVAEFDTDVFKPFSIGQSKPTSRISTALRSNRSVSAKSTKSILKNATPQDLPQTQTKAPIIQKRAVVAHVKTTPETQLKPAPIAKSQSTLSKEIRGRNVVPHDSPLAHFSHDKYCSEAPSGMITKSLAYSSRSRNTTFGKSNRIEFLRQLRDSEGAGTVRPPYPPSYHGPGGEGQQFALGLTLAGSAESDRILGPICTYGNVDRKFHHPRCSTSFPVSPPIAKLKNYQDPRTAHSMKEFLMLDEDTRLKTRGTQKSASPPAPAPTSTITIRPLVVHTRYSSNPDWSRDTRDPIQPPPTSHFYMTELDRFARKSPLNKQRQRTGKGLVRDKNVNAVSLAMS